MAVHGDSGAKSTQQEVMCHQRSFNIVLDQLFVFLNRPLNPTKDIHYPGHGEVKLNNLEWKNNLTSLGLPCTAEHGVFQMQKFVTD